MSAFRVGEAFSGADNSTSWHRRPPSDARVEWIARSPLGSGAHPKQVNCLINSSSQLEVVLVNILSSDVHSWLIAHMSLVPQCLARRRGGQQTNFPAALECQWRKDRAVFISDCLWPLSVHYSDTVVISTWDCDFIHFRLFLTVYKFEVIVL